MLQPRVYVKSKRKVFDVEEIHFDINVVAYHDEKAPEYVEVDFSNVEFMDNTGFKDKNGAKIYNDGWEPNWCNIHQDKYCIEITPSTGHFYIARRHAINHLGLLPCLKSEELAGAFINEFGERIKELLIDDCTKGKIRREE